MLTPQLVWVELLYHEILLFPTRYGEEGDGSIPTEAAERLRILQGLLLDNKQYHESFEFLRLRIDMLTDAVEIVYVVSDFMTSVRTDWVLANSYFIRAKSAFEATAYEVAKQEISSALRYFTQYGNEIGVANSLLLLTSIPGSETAAQLDALRTLQQVYKHLSYPYGLVSCLPRFFVNSASLRRTAKYLASFSSWMTNMVGNLDGAAISFRYL
jgi:hypothetical protein